MNNKAFTLAEILVTLMIIGILAAMTIPALIEEQEKQGYAKALAKFYSVGNQALSQLAADSGCTGDLVCTGVFNETSYASGVITEGSALSKYFNVGKTCGTYGNGSGKCWATSFNRNYNGSGGTVSNGSGRYEFSTIDGMSIALQTQSQSGMGNGNCSNNISASGNGPLSKICGVIYVDVNGPKGPNLQGRDVFQFWIAAGKGAILYPMGGADQSGGYWKTTNGCGVNKDGGACGARVLDEGWQMNY